MKGRESVRGENMRGATTAWLGFAFVAVTGGSIGCSSGGPAWDAAAPPGIGVAGVVSGLVHVANNTSSTVTQGGSATATVLPAVSIPMPTWREPTSEAKAAPPLSAAPVWTARF
jgi:hypothetical protein